MGKYRKQIKNSWLKRYKKNNQTWGEKIVKSMWSIYCINKVHSEQGVNQDQDQGVNQNQQKHAVNQQHHHQECNQY